MDDSSIFLAKNESELREIQKFNKTAVWGNFDPSWNQREKHILFYILRIEYYFTGETFSERTLMNINTQWAAFAKTFLFSKRFWIEV